MHPYNLLLGFYSLKQQNIHFAHEINNIFTFAIDFKLSIFSQIIEVSIFKGRVLSEGAFIKINANVADFQLPCCFDRLAFPGFA
jgi:hypothetical protein